VAVPTYNAQQQNIQQPGWILPQDSSPLWQNISNIGFKIVEDEAVREGAEQGAIQQNQTGGTELVKREGIFGIQRNSDAAFNSAAEKTFLLQKKDSLNKKLTELHDANRVNPQGFDQAVQEYRSEYFQNIPEKLLPAFKYDFDSHYQEAFGRVKSERRELDRRTYSATWADSFKKTVDGITRLYENNPNDPTAERAVAEAMGKLATAAEPTKEGFYIDPATITALRNGVDIARNMGSAVFEYKNAETFEQKRTLIDEVVQGKRFQSLDESARDLITRELRERFSSDQSKYQLDRVFLSQDIARAKDLEESGVPSNLNIAALPQQMAKLGFQAPEIERHMNDLRLAQRIGSEMRVNNKRTLVDLRQMADTYHEKMMNPTGSDIDRQTNMALYQRTQQQYQQTAAAVASDPFNALFTRYPELAKNNEYNLGSEAGILKARTAIQERFGVLTPPHVPKQVLEGAKAAINRAQNADEGIQVVMQIEQQFPTLARTILESADLGSERLTAVRAYLGGNREDAALIWNAMTNETNNKKGLDYKAADIESDFRSAMGTNAFKSNPRERSDAFRAFEAVWIEAKARGITDPKTYAKNAILSTGKLADFGNVTMLAPHDTDVDAVKKTLDSIGQFPESYGLTFGDTNNVMQTPTIGDFKEQVRNGEWMLARDGERFLIVNGRGQPLRRDTPSGSQYLYIDKKGRLDVPQSSSNLSPNPIWQQPVMAQPTIEDTYTATDPRSSQDYQRRAARPNTAVVAQLTKQWVDGNMPADKLALQITTSKNQREELSAVSVYIAQNGLQPFTASYLERFDEFAWLKDPYMRQRATELLADPATRRQPHPVSGREQTPLERLIQIRAQVQNEPRTSPVTPRQETMGVTTPLDANRLREQRPFPNARTGMPTMPRGGGTQWDQQYTDEGDDGEPR
jgi:hypothetical protein